MAIDSNRCGRRSKRWARRCRAPQPAKRAAGAQPGAAPQPRRQPGGITRAVHEIARLHDPNLRCAIPCAAETGRSEPLDGRYPLPEMPEQATILAADGSQITPDRHAQVNFCLINVGAIEVRLGLPDPPQMTVQSQLFYDEQLYTPSGTMSEAQVALLRDLNERKWLVELAKNAPPPVITFTDGPMELWGAARYAG